MFDFETGSTIAFLLLLAVLVVIDRKNIEFKYGVMIRRTQKGKRLIYDVGKKYKNVFKKIGTVGVFVAVIASFVVLYFLWNSAYSILTHPEKAEPGVRFIIPEIPSEVACKYALCVPFWYWILGILTVLFSHELMHAFIARAENIKIDSFGVLSFLVLPGAFVEPDEKQLRKSKSSTKLKIYAAGSFGNLIIVAISTLLILASLFAVNTFIKGAGVNFESTVLGTPANKTGLYGTIIEVDNQPIKDLGDFIDAMNKTKPGDEMKIKTECCAYSLKAMENPSDPTKPYIGIQNATTKFVFTGFLKGFGEVSSITLEAIDWIVNLFLWLNFLNLGVGMINLLPLKPLDGGLIFEEIFKMIFKKRFSPYLINALSAFTFVLLAINVIGPYLVGPITSVFLISKFLTG